MRGPSIGVLDLSSEAWSAGATFTSTLALSLGRAAAGRGWPRPRFFADAGSCRKATAESWPVDPVPLGGPRPIPGERLLRARLGAGPRTDRLPGELRMRRAMRLPDPSDPVSLARRHGMDVAVPVTDPFGLGGLAAIGWIPDLQHVLLPDQFTQAEIASRTEVCERVAKLCTTVMVSSNAVKTDLVKLVPDAEHKTRVLPFPSLFGLQGVPEGDGDSLRSLGIPERFALVVNQFWRHKNHRLVVEAISILAREGIRIPLVMVGRPADYRDPSNSNLSSILQGIAESGIRDLTFLLGEVDRRDLVALMRSATVLVQPSQSEGWSTVVQDAKALACPLLCSDIAVLREQAPDAVGFFGADDPRELVEQLRSAWPALPTRPERASEEEALRSAASEASAYGEALADVCAESVAS